jgi:hypothetical protein
MTTDFHPPSGVNIVWTYRCSAPPALKERIGTKFSYLPHIKYTNQQDHNSCALNAILLRPDVFRNSEFFGFWGGNTAHMWGLGQHLLSNTLLFLQRNVWKVTLNGTYKDYKQFLMFC